MDGMKKCSSCGEIKSVSEFPKNKAQKNGIASQCKKCRQIWMSENRDRYRERNRVYQNNWRTKNIDKARAIDRKWRMANIEKKNKQRDRWKIENINRVRIHHINSHAKERGATGVITSKQWDDLCKKYGNKCLACGREDVKLTLDHIVPIEHGGLNVIENAQPLCSSCNSSKRVKHTDYRP